MDASYSLEVLFATPSWKVGEKALRIARAVAMASGYGCFLMVLFT